MAKRLSSIVLTLYGVERTYKFDPPVDVPGDDDEVSVGRDILADICSTEVTLVPGTPTEASFSVEWRLTLDGRTDVQLDLTNETVEGSQELASLVEEGCFDEVLDTLLEAISDDMERLTLRDFDTLSVSDVLLTDEDGNEFE